MARWDRLIRWRGSSGTTSGGGGQPRLAWKPWPMPSQTGSCRRVCVQAKIQGMARSDSTPALGLRLAGRLPMFMRPSSPAGVAAWKYLRDRVGVPKSTAAHTFPARGRLVAVRSGSERRGAVRSAGRRRQGDTPGRAGLGICVHSPDKFGLLENNLAVLGAGHRAHQRHYLQST